MVYELLGDCKSTGELFTEMFKAYANRPALGWRAWRRSDSPVVNHAGDGFAPLVGDGSASPTRTPSTIGTPKALYPGSQAAFVEGVAGGGDGAVLDTRFSWITFGRLWERVVRFGAGLRFADFTSLEPGAKVGICGPPRIGTRGLCVAACECGSGVRCVRVSRARGWLDGECHV